MVDLDKISRRPAEYLQTTGIPQLTSGLACCVLGLTTLLRSAALQARSFALEESVQWTGIALCIGVFWWSRQLMRDAVAPRGGYVAVERPRSNRILLWTVLAISALVTIPLGVRVGTPRMDSRLIWPGFAVLFAMSCAWTGWSLKSRPATLYGVYFLLVAAFLWWLPLNNYALSGVMEIAAGVPLAGYGAIQVRTFLKQNPVIDPANG